MMLFHVLFTTAMLLTPGLVTLCVRPRPGVEVDRERLRVLRARLWGATVLALAFFTVLVLARDSALGAWWDALPRTASLGAPLHSLAWLLFFPLWFLLAVPLLVATRPQPPGGHPSTRRAAALKPRDRESPVPRGAWLALGLDWLAVAAFALLRAPAEPGPLAQTSVFLTAGLVALVTSLGVLPALLVEREPLVPGAGLDLIEAYDALRRLRAWAVFGFAAAMVTLFQTLALLVALGAEGAVGVVGAVGGTLVGLGGALVGGLATAKRERILRALGRLDAGVDGELQGAARTAAGRS